ncbi:SGNH/GDSL hydrolase family protein [Vibrio toranzoniae]|uniref:SGNH/GDSL hydrolase family protein n=1 Tax=Vibrio toranzoniae TaxID=1194427 RepID=UPI00137816D6|nr:SGNH/GDSL hydrolase family protein [Vibrio toranzoniae]NAZ70743.1 SGNH/GDSL hydrolase family protein [Vibrio toranzoniae]
MNSIKIILKFILKIKNDILGKVKRKEKVLVIGDSHAAVFYHKEFSKHPSYYFKVVSVGGATVSGLTNPNSKTNANHTFMQEIGNSGTSKVIILLGEVDTGFVIWHRAETYKESVSKMLEKATYNYKSLIQHSLDSGLEVICLSTPLPTIFDNNNWGEVANLRKGISASHMERTVLTIDFNLKMEKICQNLKVSYINFDHQSINDKGVVKNKLLNSNPLDHHYDYKEYAKMILRELK